MRQGVVRQVTGMLFMVFMFQSTVGGGKGFQSKWMFSLIFGGLVGFVGDSRNFGSNCANAICIRNFLGEILNFNI